MRFKRGRKQFKRRERHLFVNNGKGGLSCCRCLLEISDASSYRIAERSVECKSRRSNGV